MPLDGLERAILGGLRRIFGKNSFEGDVLELTNPIAKKPVTRPKAVALSSEDQKKLQEKFMPLLKNKGSIPAGSLHMLGLKELKSKLGDEWPRLRDAVHQTTENVLRRELNSADSFLRIGEDVFLIGFDSADPRPAEQRVADIAQSVRQKILGETGDNLISVESLSGRLEAFNTGDIEFRIPEKKSALKKLISEKLISEKPISEKPISEKPISEKPISEKPISEKPALEKIAVAEKNILLEPALPEADPSPDDPSEDLMVKNIAEMFSKVTERRDTRSNTIDIMYVPVWDAYHGILTTFGVIPTRQNRAGVWIYEHAVLGPDPDDTSLLELDLKSLVTALEMMVELYQNEFAIFLDTQIHYRSLASAPGRERILDICREIPEFLRKYLLVQIVNIPLDAPSSTIAMRLAQLRPFFRTVVVRAPSLKTDISTFFPLGVKAVSYPAGGDQDPDEIVKYLSAYVKKGIAAQVHVTAEYVEDIDVARRLQEAGITHIGGGIIGAPISKPDNMRRCSLKNFPLY